MLKQKKKLHCNSSGKLNEKKNHSTRKLICLFNLLLDTDGAGLLCMEWVENRRRAGGFKSTNSL